MPTGFRNSAGADLEDLFEAGTVQAAGFRLSNGSNLAFAARGGATKAPDVGFRDNAGSDLSNLWLPKGAAPPVLGFDGQSYSANAQAPSGGTTDPQSQLTLALNPAGDWTVTRFVQGAAFGNGSTVVASGTWLPSGQAAADYEVQFTIGHSGDGTVTNGAATFSSLTVGRIARLNVSVPAVSPQIGTAAATITCALRRIGQAASGSTCTFSCQAAGYL